MLKNLILIENGEKYQFDKLEELVEAIIDKNYYKMTKEEKQKKLELKALRILPQSLKKVRTSGFFSMIQMVMRTVFR